VAKNSGTWLAAGVLRFGDQPIAAASYARAVPERRGGAGLGRRRAMRTWSRRFAATTAVAALAIMGVACEADNGDAPPAEDPVDDGADDGADLEEGDDAES
jgi:hypothetical protein